MCRNIKMLFDFDPPVTEEEIRAASLQFVRKVSGFNKPSKANEAAFLAAVDEIAAASDRLLSALETNAPPRSREERAANASVSINRLFSTKQKTFLDFVLSHYVSVGVEELDQAKLTPLLRLKYHDSIADAVADLGKPDEIGRVFAGFQKYLYQQQAVA